MEACAWTLHDDAVRRGDATYRDPTTGYHVFTAQTLRTRGRCCGSGCRHCPYAHQAVQNQSTGLHQTAWLTALRPTPSKAVTALFWSGGKDSYLAHRAMSLDESQTIVWLTTFDASSGWIAHQDIHIDTIADQANTLDVPVIGVPLHSGLGYLEHIIPALDLTKTCNSLAFGDLHLSHIRQWREEAFATHPKTKSLRLVFPIWGVPYSTLLLELEQSEAQCRISAVVHPDLHEVRLGERFDRQFAENLPDGIDRFGERGEFHTQVHFPSRAGA